MCIRDSLEGFEFNTVAGRCVERSRCGGRLCTDDEYCRFPQSGGPPQCELRSCGSGQALDDASGSCVTCNLQCDAEGVYPTTVGGACECASDVYCSYQADGAQARCETSACAPGQAESLDGQCVSCANACGAQEGERARLWPTTTATGECMCETQEGFYRPFGGASAPLLCDVDRDGWINRTAKATFDTASDLGEGALTRDEATLANFRCELREVDRFVLKNEWGQRRHVSVCGDEMIDYAPGATPPCADVDGIKTVVLFESDAIDEVELVDDPVALPAYGARSVKGAEVNALTRMCASLTADYNDNQVEDVLEEQAITRGRLAGSANTSTDEAFAFLSMSHFTEIHRSSYVPPTIAGAPGSYLIEERSRCDAGFPLGTLDGASGYWQSCTRDRRGDYLISGSHVGHDFGYYACSGSASGACGMPAPPVVVPQVDADGDRLPDHGLCDQTGPLADEPWRGMTHHSQFQCVVVDQSMPRASLYAPSDIEPQPYDFNACALRDCAAGGQGCQEATVQGADQPLVPEVDCQALSRDSVQGDEVGWVTVRYLGETANASLARPYVRGCVDESFGTNGNDGWALLCPGFEDNPEGVLAAGNLGDSGKLICSCNANYGGANCEIGCKERLSPGRETLFLHVGARDRAYEPDEIQDFACDPASNYCALHPPVPAEGFEGGRRGYWMCGETDLSMTLDSSGEVAPSLEASATIQGATRTYELSGGVQTAPVVREPLEFTGPVRGQNRTYTLF